MNKIQSFKLLLRRKKKLLVIITALLVLGGTAYFLTRGDTPVIDTASPTKRYYSRLTGKGVSKAVSERPILAIMVENSEEARPQTGLDDAGIVFETVTEAGITRYMALYQEEMPDEVGPVRSVRPYFVDWLMGFDASVAHVGGSQEALDLLDQRQGKSLNEFFNSGPYYRSDRREAPHNVYARTKDLVALMEQKGHNKSDFADFEWEEPFPAAEPKGTSVSINFSEPFFGVRFDYDKEANSYKRFLAGSPHLDAVSNKQISVRNLVVLKMAGDISATGEGDGLAFSNGTVREIKWKQAGYNSRLRLYDLQGNEIKLTRGDTWIAAIPGSGSVTY